MNQKPQLIIAGCKSESGEGSGMLPYILAYNLGIPIIENILEFSINDENVTVLQILPRGRRRKINVRLPLLVTVNHTYFRPRISAYGKVRRGKIIHCEKPEYIPDNRLDDWLIKDAVFVPKRIRHLTAQSAAERSFVAMNVTTKNSGTYIPSEPRQGAQHIINCLTEQGILKSGLIEQDGLYKE